MQLNESEIETVREALNALAERDRQLDLRAVELLHRVERHQSERDGIAMVAAVRSAHTEEAAQEAFQQYLDRKAHTYGAKGV